VLPQLFSRHRRRWATLGLAAVSAVAMLAAGCAPTATSQQIGKVVLIAKPTFVKLWDTQVRLDGDETLTKLALTGDTLHAITSKNFDRALAADSGSPLYLNQITSADDSIVGLPITMGDHIAYATSHSVEIYNLDGTLFKSIPLDTAVTSPPSGAHGIVFVGVNDGGGRLSAIDITKDYSPVVWQVMSFGRVYGSAAVSGHSVWFGSEDGSVRAVSFDDIALWPLLDENKFASGGAITGDVKVDARNVYFSSSDGSLYCVGRESGKLQWRFFTGLPLNTGPDVTDTTVYQYVPNTGVVAIDKSYTVTLSGSDSKIVSDAPFHPARWTAADAVRFLSEDAHYAYLVGKDNSLMAMDKKTGELAFTSLRKDLIAFAADKTGTMIYAATAKGLVLAIRPATVPGNYGELVSAQPSIALPSNLQSSRPPAEHSLIAAADPQR